jgi:DnaK suppressor protein
MTICLLNFKELIMEQKDIEHFKKILANQLKELLIHAGDTVSGMTTPRENFPDPADRATIETDRNFMLRIRDRERQLAGKIRKALLLIENGTFGICEKCEEEISFKRIEARPVTTQCIDCKTKEEIYENALGV